MYFVAGSLRRAVERLPVTSQTASHEVINAATAVKDEIAVHLFNAVFDWIDFVIGRYSKSHYGLKYDAFN